LELTRSVKQHCVPPAITIARSHHHRAGSGRAA
jgi:hypothetical protein